MSNETIKSINWDLLKVLIVIANMNIVILFLSQYTKELITS